ncbi:MAG: glycosyltransferase family 4 protein [Anaerolineae bacterium]|jgi:glycosyltransferase involved in cell wall biosynthesis|nr:glycosyltransferase family 4 protein [Anaerolineae bacterium]MDH7473678.1 glycosyltransferase family 4 protein [Anaerolineae bacterium]
MRVAILGDYPLEPDRIAGGVEAVISYLVAELRKFTDLELHVVTFHEDVRQRYVCQQESNLTVHYLPPAYRFANVTFFVINKFLLLRELADIKPDLIHAHVAGTYAEVAHMTGLPAVLTLHGIRYRSQWLQKGWVNRLVRRPLIAREERASVRKARHIIAINPCIQEEFGPLIRATVYPIENPVPDKFFNLERREKGARILYVGRITEGKGIALLIQAMVSVRDRVPDAQLHLAGEASSTSYQRSLQDLVEGLGLEEKVHFLGLLDEEHLLEAYEQCALVVLPSYHETAPMAIQQAMAAGKPVVATRVGGVPYMVLQEETGLLVEYGDVLGLAEAMVRLLYDDALRARLGERAREEAVRRFRAAVVACRTYEVYRKLFEEFQGGKLWRGYSAFMTRKWLGST